MEERERIVGRERELSVVDRFLSASGPRLLAIEGDAGIGKSTLWTYAIECARASGYRDLIGRPARAERNLSFAGLADLFDEDVLQVVLPSLLGPRRRALEIALLRVSPGQVPGSAVGRYDSSARTTGGGLDRTALGLAVLGSLRELAGRGPVLIAVDDVQWWDAPTSEALAFALRRLTVEPVAVVVAVRTGVGEPTVDDILPGTAGRIDHVAVGPLTTGSLGRILATRLDVRYPRPVLARLCAASGWNPFLALELARSLAARDIVPTVAEPFPVPADVESLVSDRFGRLSADAREAVLVVAAVAHASTDLLGHALGAIVAERALREAAAAEVLIADGPLIRPSHPLIASAVYARAQPARRRALHRRLARIVVDPEERARHLALGSDGPNAAVATALDVAAGLALARGAPSSAAELGQLAVLLTPSNAAVERDRRRLAVVGARLAAGHLDDARSAAAEVLDGLPPGPTRVPVLLRLADVEVAHDDRTAAVRWCEQGLIEAGDDPALQARCHATIAASSPYDVERETAHARAAIDILAGREMLEPSAVATALSTLASNDVWAGRGFDRAAYERALDLEPAADLPLLARPSAEFGPLLLRIDAFAEARGLLEASLAQAIREGNESARMTLLLHFVGLETLTGHLAEAAALLDEIDGLAAEVGFEIGIAAAYRAQVDAMLGAVDAAVVGATAGLAAAELDGDQWSAAIFARPLGFIALSLADWTEAVRQLARSRDTFLSFGVVEPNASRLLADLIEALILAGRLEEAEPLLAEFERRAEANAYPWSLATSARCRGLLLAAGGQLDLASVALDGALVVHDRLDMPFERARTLLAAGAVHRRARRKRSARGALDGALALFESVGTPLWADRARAELGRISGRPAGLVGLSPTERQVAELVAGGRSNREVADELFVSVRTIESHLVHVYSKLGIRGRGSLAAALDRL